MKRRALIATMWSAGDALSRQGLQFLTTLVLARLLTPSDFGIVAMLAVFVGVAGVLADGGFSAALIQRQDVDHDDESTVFWCNLAIGLLLAALLACAGPWLAAFYHEPRLRAVTVAMAPMVLASAAGAIHFALLIKRLEFRTLAIAGGVAACVSASVSIAMAALGAGLWALVAQGVVAAVATTVLLWWLHPWRPAWVFEVASIRKLAGFGAYHLASTLMESAYTRLYSLLAGRMFGARSLGYYANAENTRQLPASFLASLVARVALPMLSQAQADPLLARRGLQLSIRVMMLLYAPIMLGLVVLAEPVVEVLYGRQWLPAVPLLQILALAGLLYPIHMINLHALMAQGHARLMFRLELIKKTGGVLLLLFGARYGLVGLAWSQVAHSAFALSINAYYTRRWLGYGVLAQLRDAAPPILAAAVAAAFVFPLVNAWPWPAPARLAVLLGIGGLSYLMLVVAARTGAWMELRAMLAQTRAEGPR
jgi:O-antigen/teichoic acid export membrane protein